MRFATPWTIVPLLLIASLAPAQYTVGPAAAPFASIAGVPGAVQLATVSGCDDCTEVVNLSFPFPWFGSTGQNSVIVTSNGGIIFDGQTQSLCCSPWALDNGAAGGTPVLFTPVARASVIQEDLDPAGAGGDIYALDTGVSMIISYENCAWFPGPTNGSANGQIELFINGEIEIRLGTINNVGNDFACGLSNPTGGTTQWVSPDSVIPQFNSVGQTTGGVVPQNTGVRFVPAGAQYQINSAASSLDLDGLQGTAFISAATVGCVGSATTMNSAGIGDYEIGIALAPSIQGGISSTLSGQIVNVNLADPSLFFLNGGATPSLIPHPGAFSQPITPQSALVATGQQMNTDATHPDGFQLSQAPELTASAGAGSTPVTLQDDNFVQIFLGGQPLCGSSVDFYGTTYTDFFVESNGGLTFQMGSGDFTATSGEWQSQMPRIGIQSDLQPNLYGTVTVTNNGNAGVGDWITVAFANVTEWATMGMGVTSYNVELHGPNGHEIGGFTTDGTWGMTPVVGGITLGMAGTHPALVSFDALFGTGLQANPNSTDSVIDENTAGMLINTNGWTSIQFPLFDGSAYLVQ